jgi:amidohydrolase
VTALLLATLLGADAKWTVDAAQKLEPELTAQYQALHRAPELSFLEAKTAELMAKKLSALGFKVTTGIGKTGVVGVFKNGDGPTVLIRTDMDALPVEEKTGLPYASKAKQKDASGALQPVMHACGHDVHMCAWLGALSLLTREKSKWKGTVVAIAQPAEEKGLGAKAMLADGLFTKFPRPDAAIALHVTQEMASGQVAIVPGFAFANVDSVDLTVHGKGGHGAMPHLAVDPIVIASRIVLTLQTLVSRENAPDTPAVVTVGSFHGGSKHNIIPDQVKLQLTVRSYTEAVRKRLLDGIARIARAEAEAAGAPRAPEVVVSESLGAAYNDPELSAKLTAALERALGKERLDVRHPIMGAEDFGEYARAGTRGVMLWLGTAPRAAFDEAAKKGETLPGAHSPFYAPEPKTAIPAGAAALATCALELLGAP